MTDQFGLYFGAFALIVASLSPLLVWWFTRRAALADRKDEHERQDAIAEKAAEVADVAAETARLLAARQDEIADQAAEAARLLVKSNEKIASVAAKLGEETTASLNQIHTLVNSNLAEAKHKELNATRAMLKAKLEVIDMKAERGQDASAEDIVSISEIEQRILDLAREVASTEVITKNAMAQKAKDNADTANKSGEQVVADEVGK